MVDLLLDILMASWAMLAEMAPYLLLGFAVAGLLSAFISPEWVERHLGGSRIGQIVKASLFGVPLPLCSCGVIPVAASLRRHGAGKGATTAFLLSTPQTGVDSIAVTWALLGPFLAVYRPVAALVTGIFGGGLVQAFDGDDQPVEPVRVAVEPSSSCCDDACAPAGNRPANRWLQAAEYGLVTLPRDIGRALIVGILLSGVISALVEPSALSGVLGTGVVPILAAMAVGVPLYVCATASVPIAVAMIHAGLSPGAALAFLISGPATNAATVTTLWRIMGRRTVVLFLLTVAVGAIGSGLLVDGVIASGLVPESTVITHTDLTMHDHEHVAAGGFDWWFRQAAAVALLLVVANALRPRRFDTEEEDMDMDAPMTIELEVAGMRCNGCVQSLTRALSELAGVDSVDVRLEGGRATIRGRDVSAAAVRDAVTSLGFTLENPAALESGL
jgi:uncharacterized membrane protein YraQ (UPF0718 family)/copper chaperone CopZ